MLNKTPAKPPKLAYLSSVIPAWTATFIYREIFELDRRGYQLGIYSIRRADQARVSAEALPLYDRAYYLLPIRISILIAAHWYYIRRVPLRYVRTLWRMLSPSHRRQKDRYRSLMHFGEGVVLAHKMESDGITHVHSHYASQPASVARVVHLITGMSYSFSAHAHDIWADRLLLREKLRETRFVACCSECGLRELRQQGDPEHAGKVHLVYHGIDVRHFAPPSDRARSSNLILAVGRFDSVKGYPHLVEACRVLREDGVNFKCRIIGDGEERSLVTDLVNRYGLNDYIELPGAVTQEHLLRHYHEAAVFVMPCIPAPDGRHDGIPNVLVEAMATALPVVTTPIGGIAELVGDGREGFLVAPGDSQGLSQRIRLLLHDSAMRHSLGESGREKIVAHFDNRRTIEPLITLFDRECDIRPQTAGPVCGRKPSGRPIAVAE